MGAYPSKKTREEVLAMLVEANVDQSVISDFNNLPDLIEKDGDNYELNLVTTWFSTEPSFYNFEFNYYDKTNYKSFVFYSITRDIVVAINNLKLMST